jgi:hypothetical protein
MIVEILAIMKNSKLLFSLGCVVAVMLSAPVLTAAPHGGGGGGGRGFMGGRPGMMGRPGMGAWGGQRWGGNWHGGNWHGGNWHGGNWHHNGNNVIFIGSFGFPWWWGWGWDPWWSWGGGWGWGYPYGYGSYGYGYPSGYGSGDPYGYGYGYGYGGNAYGESGYRGGYSNATPTHSRVAELQRRLARAGYYHGSVDGVLGPQTRRAIRAYERDHGYAS